MCCRCTSFSNSYLIPWFFDILWISCCLRKVCLCFVTFILLWTNCLNWKTWFLKNFIGNLFNLCHEGFCLPWFFCFFGWHCFVSKWTWERLRCSSSYVPMVLVNSDAWLSSLTIIYSKRIVSYEFYKAFFYCHVIIFKLNIFSIMSIYTQNPFLILSSLYLQLALVVSKVNVCLSFQVEEPHDRNLVFTFY